MRSERRTKMPSTPHPTRTEYQDVIDLRNGRFYMLSFENTDSMENVPRLFLEQFPNERAFHRLQPDGRVWFHPEDIPALVESLSFWLDAYRQCARADSSGPLPHPNWGDLELASPSIDE